MVAGWMRVGTVVRVEKRTTLTESGSSESATVLSSLLKLRRSPRRNARLLEESDDALREGRVARGGEGDFVELRGEAKVCDEREVGQ